MLRSRVVHFVSQSLIKINYQIGHSLRVKSPVLCPTSITLVCSFGGSECLWAKKGKADEGIGKKRSTDGGTGKKKDTAVKTENMKGSGGGGALQDLEKARNLELILGFDYKPTKRAFNRLCSTVARVPIQDLKSRRDYFRDRGVRAEYFYAMPWLLTQDTGLFEFKLKRVMSILKLDFDYALPFTKLETNQLKGIRKTWTRDRKFQALLQEGKMRNRLELLKAEMGVEKVDIITMVARRHNVALTNLEELLNNLNLVKDFGMKTLYVTRDPKVLGLRPDTLVTRMDVIRPHQLDVMRPWMFHGSKNQLETYIRRYTKEREALGGHSNRVSLLRQLLECTTEELKRITTIYKRVLTSNTATELNSKIHYLQDKRFTLKEIKRHIWTLKFSKNTLSARYNELRRYKSCRPPSLKRLYLDSQRYNILLQRLEAAEKGSKAKSHKDNTNGTSPSCIPPYHEEFCDVVQNLQSVNNNQLPLAPELKKNTNS